VSALPHRIVVQRLIEQGRCRQCCKPIGEDPRHPRHRKGPPKCCRVCLDKAAALNLSRRLRRMESGLCVVCGHSRGGVDAATTGTPTMCRPCSNRINARALPWQRQRYADRKASGLCVYCPKPRGANGTARECRECADKSNARKRVNRAMKRA